MDQQNEVLEQQNNDLEQKAFALHRQVQETETRNNELVLQAQKLTEQIEETEAKEKAAKEALAKHDLRAETLKLIAKETSAETKNIKSAAVPVNNLFGGEEYVKVKKNDWNKILDAFNRAVSRDHLLEKYEKKIASLDKKAAALTGQLDRLKRFVEARGLGEEFMEYVRSLAPKSIRQRLEEAGADAAQHNRQRKKSWQEIESKNKQWQQEI